MGLRDAIQTDRADKTAHTAPHRRIRELSRVLDAEQWADLLDCLGDESIMASELSRAFRAKHSMSLGEKAIRAWRDDPDAIIYVGRANVAA